MTTRATTAATDATIPAPVVKDSPIYTHGQRHEETEAKGRGGGGEGEREAVRMALFCSLQGENDFAK
jgi:hypothetical protein